MRPRHRTRTRRSCLPALLSLLVTAAACGDGSPADEAQAPAWSEEDSAGVVVVTNTLERLPDAGWTVDPEPLLVLGGMDAPESHQLYQVDGATRLPDGRIAVASAGTFDIRVFDAQGALVARYGAEGDGPDEFRSPRLVGRWGADTLVVLDSNLNRLTWIHADEGPLGSVPVSWEGKGYPLGRALLDDGSVILGGGMLFSSADGFPNGVIRPESTFGWIGRDGVQAVAVGDFPAAEMFARASERGFMARGVPFSRVTAVAPAGDGIWLGTGDSWEIRRFGPDGAVDRVVRTDAPPRNVTPGERRAYVEEEVADASTENEGRQLRDLLSEMPFPATFPPYQMLVTDAAGDLWAEDYLGPGEDTPSWTVFNAQGHLLTRVTTPPRTRILEIGPDYILGRTLDELDVETLTLWRLRRG